jgi:hypothetical protein
MDIIPSMAGGENYKGLKSDINFEENPNWNKFIIIP